jgi:hypothetical protein
MCLQSRRFVVYDNACHLAIYAVTRESHLFHDTVFTVDQLHFANYTACCVAFDSLRHVALEARNMMRNEQENSILVRLRPSLSYMTQHNFMFMIRLFCSDCVRNVDQIGSSSF